MAFLDKMKEGITKGIDTIGAKGKELVEEVQVKGQISSLQDQRKKAIEELGAAVYGSFQEGKLADPGVKGWCESVAALDRQIAAKQAELVQIHDKHPEPAAAPSPAPDTATVKCECGAENAAGVNFCPSCGKKNT